MYSYSSLPPHPNTLIYTHCTHTLHVLCCIKCLLCLAFIAILVVFFLVQCKYFVISVVKVIGTSHTKTSLFVMFSRIFSTIQLNVCLNHPMFLTPSPRSPDNTDIIASKDISSKTFKIRALFFSLIKSMQDASGFFLSFVNFLFCLLRPYLLNVPVQHSFFKNELLFVCFQ